MSRLMCLAAAVAAIFLAAPVDASAQFHGRLVGVAQAGPWVGGGSGWRGQRRLANRALRQECRARAAAEGWRGRARQSAVLNCVASRDPLLAQRMSVRMACRQQLRRAGYWPGTPDFRLAVRSCVRGA